METQSKNLFAPIKTFYRFIMSIVERIAENVGISKYFARFLVSGVINTIFGYFAFAFFIFIGCGDFTAPLFANIAGTIFNFNTIGGMVFGDRSKKLFWRFCLVYIIVYIFQVAGLKIFAACGVENRYLSGFILLVPGALLSYFLNKKFVFKK
jgi:putative flippase GtrA